MKINLTSIFVNDQEKALQFYTSILGFIKKNDVPAGDYRWLTVVSPEDQGGVELLLEPNVHPAAKSYQEEIFRAGIPATTFFVDDLDQEFEKLNKSGVNFVTPPAKADWGSYAIIDDTCGNLIMISQLPSES
jgi:predicted enzyme related to lactoylglutathione lyase